MPFSSENLAKVKLLCTNLGGEAAGNGKDSLEPKNPADDATKEHLQLKTPESYTIPEVMNHAANIIEHGFPNNIWIIGEVQNLQQRRGALYFDFAEADNQGSGKGTVTIKATIWRSSFERICGHHGKKKIEEVLQDDMKIRCLCQVSLYKGRGQLSLNIINIDPKYTKGALALAREALLKELRLKGLDKKNKSLKLPAMPLKIGLLSAPESRALSDFTHQLEAGKFPGELVFIPCSMQGEKVCNDVIRGIAKLSSQACDLIVITRGGGSAADLRWFDMPELAYAIAHSPIPVLAAIGHHDDYCVAEEICFNREKTPTAAADFIIGQFSRLNLQLDHWIALLHSQTQKNLRSVLEIRHRLMEKLSFQWQSRLNQTKQNIMELHHTFDHKVNFTLREWEHELSRYSQSLVSFADDNLLEKLRFIDQSLAAKLSFHSQSKLHQVTLKVEQLSGTVRAKDPSPWMQKGFTILESNQEKLSSIKMMKVGQEIRARLLDGLVELKVAAITPKEKKEKP